METPFAAVDVAIYNSEDDAWYRLGDQPWKVRDAIKGPDGKYVARTFKRVKAISYGEAVELLFGHAPFLPALERAAHRSEIA